MRCSGGPLGSTRDVVVGRDGGGGARKEDPGRRDDDEGIGDGGDNDTSPLNKRRYGSDIDYLEAKYVWGMMIDDCDETPELPAEQLEEIDAHLK